MMPGDKRRFITIETPAQKRVKELARKRLVQQAPQAPAPPVETVLRTGPLAGQPSFGRLAARGGARLEGNGPKVPSGRPSFLTRAEDIISRIPEKPSTQVAEVGKFIGGFARGIGEATFAPAIASFGRLAPETSLLGRAGAALEPKVAEQARQFRAGTYPSEAWERAGLPSYEAMFSGAPVGTAMFGSAEQVARQAGAVRTQVGAAARPVARGIAEGARQGAMAPARLLTGIPTEGGAAPKAAKAVPKPSTTVPAKLPPNLKGAKPGFNIGTTSYIPQFDSDLDKALFILAQTKKSPHDADYLQWAQGQLQGLSEEKIRALGRQVKARVKATVAGQPSGVVRIPTEAPLPAAKVVPAPVTGVPPGFRVTRIVPKDRTANLYNPTTQERRTLTALTDESIAQLQQAFTQEVPRGGPVPVAQAAVAAPRPAPAAVAPQAARAVKRPSGAPAATPGGQGARPAAASVELKTPSPVPPSAPAGVNPPPPPAPRQPNFQAGPRAVTMTPREAPPSGALPPPPEAGFPSGRVPGGPGRATPPPLPRDPYERLTAATDPDEEAFVKRVLRGAPEQMYDRVYPFKELEERTGIPAYVLSRLVPGAQMGGEDVMRLRTGPVMRRLKAKDDKSLVNYLALRRTDDIAQRYPGARMPGGLNSLGERQQAMRTLRRSLGEKRFTNMESVAEDLWKLNDEEFLQVLRDGGILSNKQYLAIKTTHPHYFPFKRQDFMDTLEGGVTRPEANVVSTGIQRMTETGSERALDRNALERFLSQPIRARILVARNKAARAVVEALEQLQKATGDELVRYVEPKGAMRREASVTGVVREVRGKAEHSQVWDTISYYDDGVLHTVEVPAVYAQAARGMNAEPDNLLLTISRGLNWTLRRGATEYNPAFIPVNVIRDGMSAMFREKLVPFGPGHLQAIWDTLVKNERFSEAARDGVFMGGLIETMRGGSGIRSGLGAIRVRNPVDALLVVPRLISETNVTMERATRLAVYRKLRAEGVDRLHAALRARDATVDFAKAGHSMRVINQVIPFSNAALQGGANMVRTIRDHPARSLAFAAGFTATSALVATNNLRFETSGEIPTYEFTRHWVIQFAEGTRKDGSKFPIYLKIPKGEIAALLTFPAEAILLAQRATEDRSAVQMALEGGMNAALALFPVNVQEGATSVLPGGLGTGVGVGMGKDPFTGQPIVPRGEEQRLPEQQFGAETSRVAVALGQATGISPRVLDWAIKDATAGAGRATLWVTDMALEAAGYKPEPFGAAVGKAQPTGVEGATRNPVVARFMGTRATQSERRGWEQFDTASEKTNREFAAIPGMNRLGVKLGEVGGVLDLAPGIEDGSVELTPAERAEYQEVVAKKVTAPLRQFIAKLNTTLAPEEQREKVQKEIGRLKDNAAEEFRERLLRQRQQDGQLTEPEKAYLTLQPYWSAAEDTLPARLRTSWGEYQRQGRVAKKLAYLRTLPANDALTILRADQRQATLRLRMRRSNPAVDAALVRWYGYQPIRGTATPTATPTTSRRFVVVGQQK